jgi:hypothetical protein
MITEVQNQTGFEKILSGSETNRFGVIAIALLIVGCLGGVAVGLGAINNVISLILVVVPTMTTLSFLLAIAPMKWIYYAGISSVLIDILLIVYYLFQ